MSHKTRPPSPILIAIAIMVSQTMILLLESPSLRAVLPVIVAIFFGILLYWGSRVAWVVVLVGAVGQVVQVVFSDGSSWLLVANGLLAICLLLPQAVRFVWRKPPRVEAHSAVSDLSRKGSEWAHKVLAGTVGWEAKTSLSDRAYRTLLMRIAIATMLSLLLVGLTYGWYENTGGDSTLLGVIADIVWVCYAVTQVALIVMLLWGAYRFFGSDGDSAANKE